MSRPITVIPPPSAASQIQKPIPPPRLHPDQHQLQQMPTASPRREAIARTRTPSPKPSFFQVQSNLDKRVSRQMRLTLVFDWLSS